MAGEREKIMKLTDAIEAVNKSFEKQDKIENDKQYKQYRDQLAILVMEGHEVKSEEYWADSLVSLEVLIGGVSF